MKVLITGGAGFVGSSLARQLVEASGRSVEVVAFDNLRRRGSELNLKLFKKLGIRFIHGDIRTLSDITACGEDFDLFIEASAEPSVHAGMKGDPDYVVHTNLLGTYNCLKFAQQRTRKFVFLSSSRVYSIAPLRELALAETASRFAIKPEQTVPGVSSAGISEEFATYLPRSFYGATKLASEYLVQEFTAGYGLDSVIYRCGVIAGPGQFGTVDQGVFTLWVAHHYFGKPLQYRGFGGKGKQVRDLLHPADLFALITRYYNNEGSNPGTVYNVGGGNEVSTSLCELTDLCRHIVGKQVPVTAIPDTAAVDIPIFITDYRRIASETRWKPSHNVEQIVSETFDWIRQNEADLQRIFE